MKKLALALVCLVSVAFFASCTPEGDPTISILIEEGYVQNNDVVDVNTDVNFGFVMASSIETNKELSSLVIKIDDLDPDTIALTGTSFTYKDAIRYEVKKDDIIGNSTITAIVTDVAGKTATATINLSINNPSQLLETVDFDWYRLGNTQTGLEEYGLFWERNAKSPFAQIKPLDGVTLYKFEPTDWEAITTDTQKAALFSDVTISVSVYNSVDVNANATYDDVIGTKMADGTLHLLHVTSCTIGAQESQGRPIHIYGQAK